MSGVTIHSESISINQGMYRPEDPTDVSVDFSSVPPCHGSYLGDSYIDADPEQQEEDSKAHEE